MASGQDLAKCHSSEPMHALREGAPRRARRGKGAREGALEAAERGSRPGGRMDGNTGRRLHRAGCTAVTSVGSGGIRGFPPAPRRRCPRLVPLASRRLEIAVGQGGAREAKSGAPNPLGPAGPEQDILLLAPRAGRTPGFSGLVEPLSVDPLLPLVPLPWYRPGLVRSRCVVPGQKPQIRVPRLPIQPPSL